MIVSKIYMYREKLDNAMRFNNTKGLDLLLIIKVHSPQDFKMVFD